MTIQEIKRRSAEKSPYFFTPKTLKFFGQNMRSFKVKKCEDGRYLIYAPMIDKINGRNMGNTERYFNPINNELERE